MKNRYCLVSEGFDSLSGLSLDEFDNMVDVDDYIHTLTNLIEDECDCDWILVIDKSDNSVISRNNKFKDMAMEKVDEIIEFVNKICK